MATVPSLTRLEDLRKIRKVVGELFRCRGIDPPSSCLWSTARLTQAFTAVERVEGEGEGDGKDGKEEEKEEEGATQIVGYPLAVFFVTPRGEKLIRDDIDATLQRFEELPSPRPTQLVLIAGDKITAHMLRSIATWRKGDTGRTVNTFHTFREAQLRYNPTVRQDGPIWYRMLAEGEEEKETLCRLRAAKTELPQFSGSDVVMSFMGFPEGRVVEYMQRSETAGRSLMYRVVGAKATDTV